MKKRAPTDIVAQRDEKIIESKLSQLSRGLLLLNLKREMDESAYSAMGRITKNRKVIQRRQEYCSEIERVINEAKLTTHLLSTANNEIVVRDKTYPIEELMAYYNGVFLDQVHQLKDKLLRMISLILLVPETAQDSQKKDPKEVKFAPFMRKYQEDLRKVGIFELLSEWGSGNLEIALSKRTHHHHFVSRLRLNDDFLKIKMSRMMLNPLEPVQLSEWGKKRMMEIGDQSFKKWRQEIVEKQENTIKEIENNIENVAEKIVGYFNMPVKPKEVAEIINDYSEFLSSLDIKNKASINKVPKHLKDLIDVFIDIGKKGFSYKLRSVYLVGSCPRGEFIPGSSDINLYIILNNEGVVSINHIQDPALNVTFITYKALMSEEHKKDRFICWSDGVLVYGQEIKFDKKEFPKPGTLLCNLLNKGFIEELEKLRTEVLALKNPSAKILRKYSLKVIKIVMDFDFGVAMANKPFYTASRREKIEYTKAAWPTERRTITLEQIYKDNVSIRKDDFPMLIDTFLKNAKPNYEKLLAVEAEILRDNSEN